MNSVGLAVLQILYECLSFQGRSAALTAATPLMGALPELDSRAVVSPLTLMEEQLGLITDNHEVDGSTIATVGTLTEFVRGKLAA